MAFNKPSYKYLPQSGDKGGKASGGPSESEEEILKSMQLTQDTGNLYDDGTQDAGTVGGYDGHSWQSGGRKGPLHIKYGDTSASRYDSQAGGPPQPRFPGQGVSAVNRCSRCGSLDHTLKDCPYGDSLSVSAIGSSVRIRPARGIPKEYLEAITEEQAAQMGNIGTFVNMEGQLVAMKGVSNVDRSRILRSGDVLDRSRVRSILGSHWESIYQLFLCKRCKKLPSSPLIAGCCGSIFCESCLLSYTASTAGSKSCPGCDSANPTRHKDPAVSQFISYMLGAPQRTYVHGPNGTSNSVVPLTVQGTHVDPLSSKSVSGEVRVDVDHDDGEDHEDDGGGHEDDGGKHNDDHDQPAAKQSRIV